VNKCAFVNLAANVNNRNKYKSSGSLTTLQWQVCLDSVIFWTAFIVLYRSFFQNYCEYFMKRHHYYFAAPLGSKRFSAKRYLVFRIYTGLNQSSFNKTSPQSLNASCDVFILYIITTVQT